MKLTPAYYRIKLMTDGKACQWLEVGTPTKKPDYGFEVTFGVFSWTPYKNHSSVFELDEAILVVRALRAANVDAFLELARGISQITQLVAV